ncbi:MAG: M28 family peptidase [Acidobacteria bacterium]|nr:MAG: M28 family peptidase [Acidobacteriota bacterium]
MRVDAERIEREASALAFPRYPGTEGDQRAIEMVAGWLREAGLEVSCEEFTYDIGPAFRALRVLLLGTGLLVAVAGILAQPQPQIAAWCLALALLAGGVLLGWSPWLERLYSREGSTRTANVIGRRRCRQPRLSLVFVAHHDSKSQNLTLPYRAGLTILTLVGSLGLAALLILGLAVGQVSGPAWLGPLLGGVAAASLATLSTLKSGNRSPGGVDNAGSVGILMELARVLPGELPADVEAIFLSTGAEEDHMVGAMRWLDRHVSLLSGRPTYALNLDGAGIPGRAVLLERYGVGRSFSPFLSKMARRAAERLEIPLRGTLLPPAMGIDAIPFVHRGIPCVTFTSGSLGPAVVAVHSADDHAENLDRDALERVARLVAATALDLAR